MAPVLGAWRVKRRLEVGSAESAPASPRVRVKGRNGLGPIPFSDEAIRCRDARPALVSLG